MDDNYLQEPPGHVYQLHPSINPHNSKLPPSWRVNSGQTIKKAAEQEGVNVPTTNPKDFKPVGSQELEESAREAERSIIPKKVSKEVKKLTDRLKEVCPHSILTTKT